MIDVSNLSISLDVFLPDYKGGIKRGVAKALSVPQDAFHSATVLKRSIDARRKKDIHAVITVRLDLEDEYEDRLLAEAPAGVNVVPAKPYEPLALPTCAEPDVAPVVVGMGPAGLFAALYLARCGLRPVVVERGNDVDQRAEDVEELVILGELNPESNIQFGEGGAGTFSDGKLTTNTKNPLTKHVLQWFVQAGAPADILWQAHPHLGSDNLPGIVRSMRHEIEARGGEVHFGTKLVGIEKDQEGCVQGVCLQDVADGTQWRLPAKQVILACGHSARDVFSLVNEAGYVMERKPFSVGVRIEHPQRMINQAQWGKASVHPALGAAEYKLAEHLPSGRSVYTFCMCPGGEVVAAASEEGGVVTNGMSNFARDGYNANAAVLVNVEPADFEGDDVLAGVQFQREIEQAAYQAVIEAGGEPYQAPSQTVGAFHKTMRDLAKAERQAAGLAPEHVDVDVVHARREQAVLVMQEQREAERKQRNRENAPKGGIRGGRGNHAKVAKPQKNQQAQTPKGPKPIGAKEMRPTYGRGVVEVPLTSCLPRFVTDALDEALPLFGKKLKGFDDKFAVMTAPETRSSSPVRIKRDSQLQAYFADAEEPEVAPASETEGQLDAIVAAEAAATPVTEEVFEQDVVADEPKVTTGLYPCGEGPGYAGGIMSAAVDGIRVAQAVAAIWADEFH